MWQKIQDNQITVSLNETDKAFNDNSNFRRIWGITDSLIMEKHILNVFILKKRDECFRILDLGCGTGRLLHQLARFYSNAEFVGIDSNLPSIERARSIYSPNCSFVLGTIEDSLSLGKFDIVICSEVYEHIDNPEKLLDILLHLVRDGGYLSISTPSGWMFRSPRFFNLKMLFCYPRKFYRLYIKPELHWKEAVEIHPAIKPAKLIKMLRFKGFILCSRQSSLWLISERSIIHRIIKYLEKKNRYLPATKFYHVINFLESIMNLLPFLCIFESRFVLLMKKR